VSQRDRKLIESCIARHSIFNPVRWLLRIGIVRPYEKSTLNLKLGKVEIDCQLKGPFSWEPKHIWVYVWKSERRIGFFRNLPGVVNDVGTWLPRRWGFYIVGFEFGQRG